MIVPSRAARFRRRAATPTGYVRQLLRSGQILRRGGYPEKLHHLDGGTMGTIHGNHKVNALAAWADHDGVEGWTGSGPGMALQCHGIATDAVPGGGIAQYACTQRRAVHHPQWNRARLWQRSRHLLPRPSRGTKVSAQAAIQQWSLNLPRSVCGPCEPGSPPVGVSAILLQ